MRQSSIDKRKRSLIVTISKPIGFILCLLFAWAFSGFLLSTLSISSLDAARPTALHATLLAQDASPAGFDGVWYTNVAKLDLTQDGEEVVGSIVGYGGNWTFDITGTVDIAGTGADNVLTVAESEVIDAFSLTISEDGQQIQGEAEDPLQWCGVREGPLPDGCGYSGTWTVFSEDYITPVGSYVALSQDRSVVTGALLSMEQTELQTIQGVVNWGKGYQLEIVDNELFGLLAWFQDGNAFGTDPNGRTYQLRISRAASVSPFLPSAFDPPLATEVDREEAPLALPAPLYYINPNGQIMYMDPARFEAVQLTDEAAPVTSFDVAKVHSGLVYVVNQQLVELDIVNKTRTVLFDAAAVDAAEAAEDEAPPSDQDIHNPRYSPDGAQIIYVHNGLSLIDSLVDTNDTDAAPEPPAPDAPTILAADILFDEEEPNPGDVRRYIDAQWSPSGRYLLTSFSRWEGLSSDVIEVATGESQLDEQLWIPCCDSAWGTSDETVVIASDALIYGRPGLYQIDLSSGQLIPLFDGQPNQSNLTVLAQGGHQSQSGETFALLSQRDISQPALLNNGLSYALHQISRDGTIAALNPSGIAQTKERLWAEDGSGLIVANTDGILRWLPVDGETITNLFVVGSNLRWGEDDPEIEAAIATYTSEAFPSQSFPEEGLAKQVSRDLELDLTPSFAGVTIGTRYLNAPTQLGQNGAAAALAETVNPVWAAYSTEMRDFDQELGHWVALYTQEGGTWEQLALLQFPIDIDRDGEPETGPDYVGLNALKSANFSTDRHWFSLEGGVGAHSSVYYLLSFDGEELAIQARGFSSAGGGAGRVHNANNDDITDYLILDNTDYYVFCYACGVRRVQYQLLRWDGTQMVSMELTPLGEETPDDAITPELRALNNRSVALAQAGLWYETQEMLTAIYQTITPFQDSAETAQLSEAEAAARDIIENNITIISTHVIDIQQDFYNQNSVYPLLTNIFYGDYGAAYNLVRELPAEEIFNQDSPLISGTVAEGWPDALAENILISTEPALAYAPERAEIHFFSGWANWLLGNTEEAGAAVAKAAELAPTEATYQQALAIVWPEWEAAPADAETDAGDETEAEDESDAGQVEIVVVATDSDAAIETLDLVNLRSGPGIEYDLVGAVETGEQAPVLGKSEDGLWWLVSTEALELDTSESEIAEGDEPITQAWISANPEYTAEISATEDDDPDSAESNTDESETAAQLEALDLMNLRSGPSIEDNIVGKMQEGELAPVLGKSEDGLWWLISTAALDLEPSEQGRPTTQAWISANLEYTEVDNPLLVPVVDPEDILLPEAQPDSQEPPADNPAEPSNSSDAEDSGQIESPPALVAQLDTNVTDFAFNPDGSALFIAGSQGLSVWSTVTWNRGWTEQNAADASMTQVAVSPTGTRVIIGRSDGEVRLLDATTSALIDSYILGQSIEAVDFSADGTLAAAGSFDGKLMVADAATGTTLTELQNELPVFDLALAPNGPWVAAMTGGSQSSADFVVWDFLTTERRSLSSHNTLPNVSNVAFSPDARWVAGALQFGDTVKVWQTQTWPEVAALASGDGRITELLFSPNNARLVALMSSGEGGEIVVWETSSWSELNRIPLPDIAWDMDISPDSRFLLVGLGQNSVTEAQIWDIESGQQIARLPHPGQVTNVSFSQSGQWIATGGGNSNVHIWQTGGLEP